MQLHLVAYAHARRRGAAAALDRMCMCICMHVHVHMHAAALDRMHWTAALDRMCMWTQAPCSSRTDGKAVHVHRRRALMSQNVGDRCTDMQACRITGCMGRTSCGVHSRACTGAGSEAQELLGIRPLTAHKTTHRILGGMKRSPAQCS